tara:strand:+ start:23 stop:655 length:633 start_codon:yes stop_codon:yes gene_type:complete
METIRGSGYQKPFPHLILKNFYTQEELRLIWQELDFYTQPGKLFDAKDFGGVVGRTNSHAIALDELYYNKKLRKISNILQVNRKLFDQDLLSGFAKVDDCCGIATMCNDDITKVRYYHDGEYYEPHTDLAFQFLSFSYFYREPKKFIGGEVYFPQYDYEYPCYNNSVIMFPGWVKHGVRTVKIDNSDYFEGKGRYCISSFFGFKDFKDEK